VAAGESEYIIPLEAGAPRMGVARVGRKAAVLGALSRAGFPVPAGLCVTTAAFRLALGPWLDQIDATLQRHDLHDPAGAERAAEIIAGLLTGLAVPAPVMASLCKELPAIAGPDTPLAVRSSATAEDSAQASFAGQYASVIGVHGGEPLQDAMATVWRSFFSPNALVARAAHGSLGRDEAMAVLILPVIDAECAGVSFSVDPVHPRSDRIVITAAWGLGAGVVDGSVATDTAWVRRQDFEIDEHRVAEKPDRIALDPQGGLRRETVSADRRRAACLPEPWLQRLAQFCAAAELLFGCPQDMEWVIAGGQVWVLQSRPITGLPPGLGRAEAFPVTWQSEGERRLPWVPYTYWRHVLTPLETDYAHDREAAQIESSHFSGSEHAWRAKIVNGRVYTCWAPSDLPDGDRRVRRAAMTDLAIRLHQQGITTWEYWGPEVVRATQRLGAFEVTGADGRQLAEHLEEARGASRRHWVIHGLVWQSHDQPLYDAYAAVSGLPLPEAQEAASKLLEGEENPTTRMIDGLYALACAAQAPAVAELVAAPPPDVVERLGALPEAAAFLAQLEAFLGSYGGYSGVGYGSDDTIRAPTWGEAPGSLLHFVARYLGPGIEPPASARARAQGEREALVKRVCDACNDPAAVAEFRHQLAFARRQAAVAEEHNHYIDQLANGQLRRAIVAAADWLVVHNALATRDEILWLHYDEILAALRAQSPPSFAEIVYARQARHAEWEELEPPPILGIPEAELPDRPPLQDEVTPEASRQDDQLTGLGASPGRRRGRARVIPTSVLLPDLSPGDVLVAENMGPRWTPLLPILGGLVLDGGALGQHHAITAREYGVPAVIGTRNATRLVPDGTWVTVDGTAGIVEVEFPAEYAGGAVKPCPSEVGGAPG
jgi:phosphohistidine swiveling domain-containing protein